MRAVRGESDDYEGWRVRGGDCVGEGEGCEDEGSEE